MASITNVLGVFEFYSHGIFQEVNVAVQNLPTNFFNLSMHENYLQNRGSILLPFAKNFRADDDDEDFVLDKMKEICRHFSFVDLFSIQYYLDSPHIPNTRFTLICSNGRLNVTKHRCEAIEIANSQISLSQNNRDAI